MTDINSLMRVGIRRNPGKWLANLFRWPLWIALRPFFRRLLDETNGVSARLSSDRKHANAIASKQLASSLDFLRKEQIALGHRLASIEEALGHLKEITVRERLSDLEAQSKQPGSVYHLVQELADRISMLEGLLAVRSLDTAMSMERAGKIPR